MSFDRHVIASVWNICDVDVRDDLLY